MAPSFDDIVEIAGLPRSAYGEAMYARGRELVVSGVDLSQLVWDADEVLWDWSMSGARLLGLMPFALFGWLGHREYVAMRPGMLELLWGMRHAALELGRDPHVRIWTSGYPWRLWRILREVPGFDELLGPPFALAEPNAEVMRRHPRVFTRGDYIAVMRTLIAPSGGDRLGDDDATRASRDERLAAVPEAARATILAHLAGEPDSGFKIAELALLLGKDAFAGARYLIDDVRLNVEWFKAAGKSAVHVRSRRPRIAFGRIPHTAWAPRRFLRSSGHGAASAIADALATLAAGSDARIAEAAVGDPQDGPPNRVLAIDIPNAVLWREWITPMRALRKAMRPSRWLSAHRPISQDAWTEKKNAKRVDRARTK